MQRLINSDLDGARPTSPARLCVAILAMDGVELDEVTRARQAFELAQLDSVIVGPTRGRIDAYRSRSAVGYLDVELSLDASELSRWDGLFVPGGVWHADGLRSLGSVVSFVRGFAQGEKPIAALGHAVSLLIEADLVEGRSVSGAPSLRTDLVNAGADFVDRDVVQDGFVLSGRSVPAFYGALAEHYALRAQHSGGNAGAIGSFWARLRRNVSVGAAVR